MKRIEQRYQRLLKEHVPYWEARSLAKATEYPLAHPAMRRIRSLRKLEWRQQKIGKRDYSKRVGFFYEAEGLREKGKYQVREHIRQVSQEPLVVKAIRLLRAGRETSAGHVGRMRILVQRGKFFPWEARRLLSGLEGKFTEKRHIFESYQWQAMIRNHRAYVEKMMIKTASRLKREMGSNAYNRLSNRERLRRAKNRLNDLLLSLYNRQKYDVFDWLKKEYRPKKVKQHYEVDKKRRATKRTSELLASKKQQQRQLVYFD